MKAVIVLTACLAGAAVATYPFIGYGGYDGYGGYGTFNGYGGYGGYLGYGGIGGYDGYGGYGSGFNGGYGGYGGYGLGIGGAWGFGHHFPKFGYSYGIHHKNIKKNRKIRRLIMRSKEYHKPSGLLS